MRVLEPIGGLRVPQGVAVHGQIAAVADTGNHRIAFFDLAGQKPALIETVGAEGTEPNHEGFLFPSGLCFTTQNRLVVADTWNKHLDIYKSAGGSWTFQNSISLFSGVTPIGNLVDVIAEDSNKVLVLDMDQKRILKVNITDSTTFEYFSNPNWSSPSAIATGGGYFWVADAGRHQVFRYDTDFNEFTFGSYGVLPGQLQAPRGLTVDPNASLVYVSESQHARISSFDFEGNLQESLILPSGVPHELYKIKLDKNARLLACDAGANKLYIVQLDVTSSLPFLERSRLEFGSVGIGYRLPLPVVVHNPSQTDVQISSVDISGSQFHLDATTAAFPQTVPGNSSLQLLVMFAPTTAGLAVGQLRLNLAHTEAVSLTTGLRGEGFSPQPATIALVIDRSGSMLQSSGEMSKIERMRQAVGMFIDVASWRGVDELSVVSFSNSASVEFPRTTLTEANADMVRTAVSSIIPRGMTSIGAGLQLALTQLAGSEIARKEIIVLTDGKENTSPMISDISLPRGSIRVFTVGLGLPELLDTQKLLDLATVNGGYFQVTDEDESLLPKFFTQILSTVSGQQFILDPRVEVGHGQEIKLPFYLSDSEFNAIFILTWEHYDSMFEVYLVGPDGRALRSNLFEHHIERPGYQAFRVSLRGTRWEKPGKWYIHMRLIKASVRREVAFLSISVESEIQPVWKITQVHKKGKSKEIHPPTGARAQLSPMCFPKPAPPIVPPPLQLDDAMQIRLSLRDFGLGSKIVRSRAEIIEPRESLTKLLERFQKLDLDSLQKLPKKKKYRAKQIFQKITGKISKSRQESLIQVALGKGKTDGFFQAKVSVQGITRSGHRFQRERYFQMYIPPSGTSKIKNKTRRKKR
ncbi:MAG TPA: hypothetical protein DD706_21815 [Nitrospiraceae bacterium]|nr:hypothetical protein [Nitrospiraceae bacterium]